jgi:hypothetical protein
MTPTVRPRKRQIVVDGDDVDALALERVQVGGEGGDEGLALARLHLRDHPAVERQAADQLDVEVTHVEHAPSGLAHDGEGLGEQRVEGLALGETAPELDRPGGQGAVVELAHGGLEGTDLGHHGADALQLPLVLGADDAGEDGVDHARRWPSGGCGGNLPGHPTADARAGRAPTMSREYQPLPVIATGGSRATRDWGGPNRSCGTRR